MEYISEFTKELNNIKEKVRSENLNHKHILKMLVNYEDIVAEVRRHSELMQIFQEQRKLIEVRQYIHEKEMKSNFPKTTEELKTQGYTPIPPKNAANDIYKLNKKESVINGTT